MERFDVAVVGGGVVGLSAAWRLARAGRTVALFEQFPLGHDRGSSHGPTRIFRFAYDDPTYVKAAQHALPLWLELEQATGRRILEITGGFDVGDLDYLERCERALREGGAGAEWLTPHERAERFPWFDAGDEPALFSPDTGAIAADVAMGALSTAARDAGAQIRDSSPVEQLVVGDDVSFIAGGTEVRAATCVVAGGAWITSLLKPLGIDVPIRVTREQVFYFQAASPIVPFIHRGELARYGVPMFGSAPGVKIAEHMTGIPVSPDERGFDAEPEGAARVAAYVRDTLPGLFHESFAYETCLYSTTPDEGFILDASGPLIIASACSGHGFKFGPATGQLITSLVTGEEPPISLEPFAIARFA